MTNKNISGQVAWGIIIAFLVILAVIFIGPILFAALVVSGITMESKSFWVLVVLVVAAIGAIYQEHQNKVEGEILAQRRHEYELEHMKAMSVIEKAYPAKPRIQIDEFAASKPFKP